MCGGGGGGEGVFAKRNFHHFSEFILYALYVAPQQHNNGVILFVVFMGVQFVQKKSVFTVYLVQFYVISRGEHIITSLHETRFVGVAFKQYH